MEKTDINPPTQTQENKSVLMILGIEVGVLLVVVLLIVGVLNYFNIFSLSRMNPQIFGWLPHQPLNAEQAPSSNLSQGNTLEDLVSAQVMEFLTSALKVKYQPKQLGFKTETTDSAVEYSNEFINNKSNARFVYYADKSTSKPQNIELYIFNPYEIASSSGELNQLKAYEDLGKYFVLPNSIDVSKLKKIESPSNVVIWEAVWENADGTKDTRAAWLIKGEEDTYTLLACKLFSGNSLFERGTCFEAQ